MDGLPGSFGEVSPEIHLNSKKTVRFRLDFGGKELNRAKKTAEKQSKSRFFDSFQSACLK